MKNNILLTGLFAFFAIFGLTLSNASPALADAAIYTGTFSDKAVKGYDTVTYFQGDGVPVKGSEEFQTEWRGATWLFSSAENLALFNENPEKYAPQYGGYCAWATAHGSLAKGDPNVYTLKDGKVYLNYDKSIHKKWLPRSEELIETADAEYPELVDIK